MLFSSETRVDTWATVSGSGSKLNTLWTSAEAP